MFRPKQFRQGKGLRYALGEVLLIFIGITAAIWFQNWNENRLARKVEKRLLIEIKAAIEQDLEDINDNIFGFSKRLAAYDSLTYGYENNKPFIDEKKQLLPYLRGLTTFLSSSGPYETLKSRGLATISDDSLRHEISNYYDFLYDMLKSNEREDHNHYNQYMKPMLLRHFSLRNHGVKIIDPNALQQDFEFWQNIYWAKTNASYMLRLYENLKSEAQSIVEMIEREVE